MFGLELDQAVQAYVALAILLGMLVLFIKETYPVEVTAIGGAALMLLLGILPQDAAVEIFSNAAPWTIAACPTVTSLAIRRGNPGSTWSTALS